MNTIGSYKGTVPLDFMEGQQTPRIQVEADGSWKMTVKPLSSVRRFASTVKGKGDDVLYYTAGPKVANIKHTGSENFAVWYYGEDGNELLVNEIGNYQGQSRSPVRPTSSSPRTASGASSPGKATPDRAHRRRLRDWSRLCCRVADPVADRRAQPTPPGGIARRCPLASLRALAPLHRCANAPRAAGQSGPAASAAWSIPAARPGA